MTHPALWVVKEVTDNHKYDAARGKRVAAARCLHGCHYGV